MATVFYSWQSDTDSRTNHNFLKVCLRDALAMLAAGDELEEVIRGDELTLDHDTAGVFGDVEVLDTILGKIQTCDLFVADITIVATTGAGKQCPNPNVLLELGYAIDAAGPERTLKVMNEYYGTAAAGLPFDMTHKRFPYRYTLAPDADPTERKKVQKQVTGDLAGIIGGTLQAVGPKKSPIPEFYGAEPVWEESSFIADGSIGLYPHPGLDQPEDIFWVNGAQYFARIIPHKCFTGMTTRNLLDLVDKGDFPPLGMGNTASVMPRADGVLTFEHRLTGKPVLRLSQLFSTGEIWGIEKLSSSAEDGRFVPWPHLKGEFFKGIEHYLAFTQKRLGLDPPLKIIVGVSGIANFSLALPNCFPDKAGHCPKKEIVHDVIVDSFDIDINELLSPFFQKIWEEFGLIGGWQ